MLSHDSSSTSLLGAPGRKVSDRELPTGTFSSYKSQHAARSTLTHTETFSEYDVVACSLSLPPPTFLKRESERDTNSHVVNSNRGMARHRIGASLILYGGKHGNTIVTVHIRSTLTWIISKDVHVASLFRRKVESTVITRDRRERSSLRNQIVRSFTLCVIYRIVRSTCSLAVVLSCCFVE